MWYSLLIFAYGISWVIVYLSLIRNGRKEKIYGLPFICVINEILWEVLYSYTTWNSDISVQTFFFGIYGVLALILLFQFIKYHNTFPESLKKWKKLYIITTIVVSITFELALFNMWSYPYNMIYSSYIHTFLLCLFMLLMLWVRGSNGYDLRIAIFKIIGDVSAIILSSNLYAGKAVDVAVLFIGIALVIVDIAFLVSLVQEQRKQKSLK